MIRPRPWSAGLAWGTPMVALGVGMGGTAASCRSTASSAPSPPPPVSMQPSVVIDAGTADAGPFSIESDNPTIPVGLDAYRMWDQWPSLQLGARAYMRSTFDRSGGNEAADASHFLRITQDRAVALDVAGSGVLEFVRFNHWHGSPWHFVVDGTDNTVSETSTATPDTPSPDASFIPPAPFPSPLAMTWPTTSGADLIGVPIPFASSLRIDFERTNYGTGYFIYDAFPLGARNLSQPITAWSGAAPAQDVVDLVNQAGQDIAPTANVQSQSGTLSVPASGAVTLFDATGPAAIRAIQLTVPTADAAALGAATLRATWDGRSAPSIEAPVSLFFGAGSLVNRTSMEYLVKAFPVSIRFGASTGAPTVTFAVYFPMPFAQSAHLELVGGGSAVPAVTWSAQTLAAPADRTNWVGYLHASYVDQGTPTPGSDLVLLDTTKAEGGGAWCGSVVGTSFTFSDHAVLTTLEGDPRFFFDDSQTPQVQGTGTEEWGGGGDYWGGVTTTLPFYGHPVGAPDAHSAMSAEDQIESAYRFLLTDRMPFGKSARVQLEHGGVDDSVEHYRTVAYWYGLPGACLVQTDTLHVGDAADEAAHGYASPAASSVDTLTTRYEWGVDHVGTTVIYPATTDTGRHTTGTSELSLAIQPRNFGVLLRRKLDYGYPDQRAEVYVAPDDAGDAGAFVAAGTWYTAGSSSCVFSDPPGELDPFAPNIETSNRAWRDDEFMIPRALTSGHSRLRVRLVFSPLGVPLTPSTPPAAQAWSEYRYTAYVWVLPPPP